MKKIFFAFGAFICIPHILLFALRRKSDGGQKLSKDINVWLSRKNHSGYGQIKGLVYLLLKLKEFRNLYYHRMGNGTLIFSWILPKRSTLHIFTPSERIGGGFYIGHGWGTVVNAYCIGEGCLVAQNTTIGSKDLKTPILGNHVSIWSHCVVLGGVEIGDNSQIGSGAVVVKNIPDGCVVVPAKSSIIKKNGERVNILL